MAAQRFPWTARDFARYKARHGTPEEKFWPRVQGGPDCWIWLASVSTWGYGVLTVKGKMLSAHRLSWEIHNGPIPVGLQVCHKCDVRNCVRPDHLFLGTAKDNVADMIAKGRRGDTRSTTHRGERHYAARLTDLQIAEIRSAVLTGERHRAIAGRFGVTRQYVGMLAHGDRRTA